MVVIVAICTFTQPSYSVANSNDFSVEKRDKLLKSIDGARCGGKNFHNCQLWYMISSMFLFSYLMIIQKYCSVCNRSRQHFHRLAAC